MNSFKKFQLSLRSYRVLCKISFLNIFVNEYDFEISYYLSILFWIVIITMIPYMFGNIRMFSNIGMFSNIRMFEGFSQFIIGVFQVNTIMDCNDRGARFSLSAHKELITLHFFFVVLCVQLNLTIYLIADFSQVQTFMDIFFVA